MYGAEGFKMGPWFMTPGGALEVPTGNPLVMDTVLAALEAPGKVVKVSREVAARSRYLGAGCFRRDFPGCFVLFGDDKTGRWYLQPTGPAHDATPQQRKRLLALWRRKADLCTLSR